MGRSISMWAKDSMSQMLLFVFADVSCTCLAGYVGNGEFCNGVLTSVLATYRNFSIFYKVSAAVVCTMRTRTSTGGPSLNTPGTGLLQLPQGTNQKLPESFLFLMEVSGPNSLLKLNWLVGRSPDLFCSTSSAHIKTLPTQPRVVSVQCLPEIPSLNSLGDQNKHGAVQKHPRMTVVHQNHHVVI